MLISDKIEMRKHENSSNTRNPYKKSFTYANAKSYYEAAKELSHDVSFIDLSDGTFDPVLRYGYSHHMENETKTKEFRKLIQEADHLSFFFPIWWSAEPAILKGFLDRWVPVSKLNITTVIRRIIAIECLKTHNPIGV